MQENDIFLTYGSDASEMTSRLLVQMDVSSEIPPGSHVVIKPNLVIAATADGGATTHPEIAEAIITYLLDNGHKHISIVESSWIGDNTAKAFKLHGYDRMARRYGVGLVDVKQDDYRNVTAHGYAFEMSETILDAGYIISLPVLKGHCQTTMTCALKNMKGCISDRSKRQFHTWGLHGPIAAMNAVRCADLVLVDSLNGDLDFEEGGNPVPTNRMFAGKDSVLIDTFGASLMGFSPEDIPYIGIAQSFQVGSSDLLAAHVVELNKDTAGTAYMPSGRVRELARHTMPSSACSACHGNLIHALARLEERGLLSDLTQKVHIGQDYKGRSACGLGVGSCTGGFTRSLPGCPPRALDIVRFLERQVEE